jgi:acyl-CoA reductase-like NAD-dependent aldehyde dehydrogenase
MDAQNDTQNHEPPRPFILNGRERFTNQTVPVVNPFSQEVIYQICSAGHQDIHAAVTSAASSCRTLRTMPLYQRSRILLNAVEYLRAKAQDVVMSIVLEAGKPIRYAQAEFERCLDNLTLCAEQAKHLGGELINMDASPAGVGRRGYWFREPLGTVLAITPFNFPLNLVAHKVAPAVAAGCPIIIKPASQTPGAALWLTKALLEGGYPPEALSCLVGSGQTLAEPLIRHPGIAKITFTGSFEVGQQIAAAAGIKKTTLELGSNSAAIVDDDPIDFEYAVKRLCLGSFYYQGQVCISVQRIYVLRPQFERFTQAFVALAKTLKAGDPQDPSTEIGPMITAHEADRVKSWIDLSLSHGARLLCGGVQTGSFIQPTVLTQVPPSDPLMAQEAFGPVVVIEPVDDLEEAIRRANDSRFGLQAGIFTRRIDHAERAIAQLDVGGVIVNDFPSYRLDHMPYGGVKDSGIGREGARFAIEEMTRIKMVVINNEQVQK